MTEIEIVGCIYSLKKDLDVDEVSAKLIEFVESNGWYFGGGFRTIVNGVYSGREETPKETALADQ